MSYLFSFVPATISLRYHMSDSSALPWVYCGQGYIACILFYLLFSSSVLDTPFYRAGMYVMRKWRFISRNTRVFACEWLFDAGSLNIY